jgi:hypothetical protein
MVFDKIEEYIETIFNIFHLLNMKAKNQNQKDNKIIGILTLIKNYLLKLSVDHNIDLSKFDYSKIQVINFVPFFDYIRYKNIELFNLSEMKKDDLDVNDENQIEIFVISHIYFIYQNNM